MTINEVFPNPTVKQVIFQIRFPNLFFLESKVGDFQLKIMKEFPESSLIYRKQIVFADVGPEVIKSQIQEDHDENKSRKIWQFKSSKGYRLNVLTDSLDITSEHHKTYKNEGGDKFRDIIEYVISNFLEIAKVPIIVRVGLRYIDECPLPSKDNETFERYYNSVFPLKRFDVSLSDEMVFRTITKIDEYKIRYEESLMRLSDEEYRLKLDFDGFAENIDSDKCMEVTDKLHDIISDEYLKTIKEPVKEYMRTSNK